MYINRIILRDVRNFDELDITLKNDWTGEHLTSVLLTGPNGSGKTTLLQVIAALWENFGHWLHLKKARRGMLTQAGLAAVELRELQPFPVWLFMASGPRDWDDLRARVSDNEARFVGEIRGARGQATLERERGDWFDKLAARKERLQLGVDDAEKLPNLLFLEAEGRSIITPQKRGIPEIATEPLYQWFLAYEARERWDGHIESMLRNLKIRDARLFEETAAQISSFWDGDKKITDFDDNLRLRIQIGSKKGMFHYIDELSAGERQCLILLFMVSRWLMEGGIVLIDEPDLHLHVSWQRRLIHELERMVTAKNGQLLVTSHSPTMWEEFHEEQRIELGQPEHE